MFLENGSSSPKDNLDKAYENAMRCILISPKTEVPRNWHDLVARTFKFGISVMMYGIYIKLLTR